MGDEMKQAETGMPSLTLEPELVMEQEKEPEVQAQLMEVTQEMNPVQQKMAPDCPYAGRTADGRKFCRKDRSGKSDTGYAVWSRNTEEDG